MLQQFMKQELPRVEHYLLEVIQTLPKEQVKLKEAMSYAISSGGKRVRPLFVLVATQLAGGSLEKAIPVAGALEMIHTYSLIHDDLPGMDNDELRRGRPTLHVAFDEATAILAGDAFLTLAFTCLTENDLPATVQSVLVRLISKNAGAYGMIAGQMLDVESESKEVTLQELMYIHQQKTGALIEISLQSGLLIGNASKEMYQLLHQFAVHYGLAFQIQNDLQDVLWDSAKSGKQSGKDTVLEKNTYPSLLGVDGALAMLQEEITACKECLTSVATYATKPKEQEAVLLLNEMLEYLKIS